MSNDHDVPIRCNVCKTTSEGTTYLAFIGDHKGCGEKSEVAR